MNNNFFFTKRGADLWAKSQRQKGAKAEVIKLSEPGYVAGFNYEVQVTGAPSIFDPEKKQRKTYKCSNCYGILDPKGHNKSTCPELRPKPEQFTL